MKPSRRAATAVVLLVVVGSAAWLVATYGTEGPPRQFVGEKQHFKYGSIETEVSELPYPIWRSLPILFRDVIPQGYASFGFIVEPGQSLPVGVSVRKYGVERVGLNCAACHTSTLNGHGLILGAPAVRLDLDRYADFLIACGKSPRLTADSVFGAASGAGPLLSMA